MANGGMRKSWNDMWSFWGDFFGGGYDKVPGTSQSDYFQIDPGGYTGGAWDSLLSGLSNFGNLQDQYSGQFNQWDPQGGLNAFLGMAPQLQGLVSGATSDLENAMRGRTSQTIRSGIDTAGSELAGMGARDSSAFMEAAAGIGANASRDAAIAMNQGQMDLTGQLWNQGLGQAYGSNNLMGQLLSSLLGNTMAGQSSLYGTIGGFGAPVYGAPQYEYQPGFFEKYLPTILSVATGVPMGGSGAGGKSGSGGIPGNWAYPGQY